MSESLRSRRSCLAVPGLQPAVPGEGEGRSTPTRCSSTSRTRSRRSPRPDARGTIVEALNSGGWGDKVRVVRVNDWTTEWTYRDVIEVVEGAGANLDCIMLPKVQTAEQVVALDLLLTQIEKTIGLEVGRIGIEAQIENALGLINVDAIATASPRVETIIFGPADFMASINMKSLVVGEQPPGYDVGDAYHYILMRILMAARAHDKQAIDGPYLQIRDVDGLPAGRRPQRRARLRRQVGAAPRPDRRRQRGVLAAAGATTTTPRTSSTPTTTTRLEPGGATRRGDARRRDDRRGVAQDGAGHLGQGPRRRHDPHATSGTPPPARVEDLHRWADAAVRDRGSDRHPARRSSKTRPRTSSTNGDHPGRARELEHADEYPTGDRRGHEGARALRADDPRGVRRARRVAADLRAGASRRSPAAG